MRVTGGLRGAHAATIMAVDWERDEYLRGIRDAEFGHLGGVTYMDHAGATLYSAGQLREHHADLASHLYGNPHSQSPSSQLTSEAIDHARELVLRHFSVSSADYDVIFTAGCTAALRLLAQAFPWTPAPEGPAPCHTPSLACHSEKSGSDQNAPSSGLPGDSDQSPVQLGPPGGLNEVVYTRQPSADGDCDSLGSVCCHGSSVSCQVSSVCCRGSVFCYLEDNHTSVVGMREEAFRSRAHVVCTTERDIVPLDCGGDEGGRGSCQCPEAVGSREADRQAPLHHLFAFPAQSNFSGRKYPLSWVQDIPARRVGVVPLRCLAGSWAVLLDAASLVSTTPLNLRECPAHFVAVSFYKLFGFPTGLGALLVRSDSAHLLSRRYYGGGTVLATISRRRFHRLRHSLHDRFEDGTLPFLDIVALRHGFATLQSLGGSMQAISAQTFALAQYVHHALASLVHSNRRPVCVLYCHTYFEDPSTQGPIVNFNLLREDGCWVGYSEVDKLACVYDIHIRTGCFCNTGACMIHLGLSADTVVHNAEAGHECGDNIDIIDGKPTGSVRVSFGYMSTFEDAQKFVHFIEQCFVTGPQTETTEACTSRSPPSRSHSHSICEPPDSAQPSGLRDSPNVGTWLDPRPPSVSPLCGHIGVVEREGAVRATSHQDSSIREEEEEEEEGLVLRVGDCLEARGSTGMTTTVTLERVSLYPVKSCASFRVSRWPVAEKGLLHDREWMVLNERGACLSQKQEPRLCLLRPHLDLRRNLLTLSMDGQQSLLLPLSCKQEEGEAEGEAEAVNATVLSSASCLARVCGDRVRWLDCGVEAADWLEQALQRTCRLVRQHPDSLRTARKHPVDSPVSLSLVNEAQFLLVTRESVAQLLADLGQADDDALSVEELLERFRPNLVICGGLPYAEDTWVELVCTNQPIRFKVTGLCSRCRMICVDQSSGRRGSEPLRSIVTLRGNGATFGVYLSAVLHVCD